jgi:hypothetical protein
MKSGFVAALASSMISMTQRDGYCEHHGSIGDWHWRSCREWLWKGNPARTEYRARSRARGKTAS